MCESGSSKDRLALARRVEQELKTLGNDSHCWEQFVLAGKEYGT